MNEWGTGNEYDYVAFVWHVVIVFVAIFVLLAGIKGC